MTELSLKDQHCEEVSPKEKRMIIPTIESNLTLLEGGWQPSLDYRTLVKTFTFKNYYQTLSFLNAMAYIAEQQAHYPVVKFSYGEAMVTLFTEVLEGLSHNDFIMAAKIDQLYHPSRDQAE